MTTHYERLFSAKGFSNCVIILGELPPVIILYPRIKLETLQRLGQTIMSMEQYDNTRQHRISPQRRSLVFVYKSVAFPNFNGSISLFDRDNAHVHYTQRITSTQISTSWMTSWHRDIRREFHSWLERRMSASEFLFSDGLRFISRHQLGLLLLLEFDIQIGNYISETKIVD